MFVFDQWNLYHIDLEEQSLESELDTALRVNKPVLLALGMKSEDEVSIYNITIKPETCAAA